MFVKKKIMLFVKFVKLPPDNSGKCVQSLSLTLSHCSSNLDLLFFCLGLSSYKPQVKCQIFKDDLTTFLFGTLSLGKEPQCYVLCILMYRYFNILIIIVYPLFELRQS